MTYEYRVAFKCTTGVVHQPVRSLRLAFLRLESLRSNKWDAHIERRPVGEWEPLEDDPKIYGGAPGGSMVATHKKATDDAPP